MFPIVFNNFLNIIYHSEILISQGDTAIFNPIDNMNINAMNTIFND